MDEDVDVGLLGAVGDHRHHAGRHVAALGDRKTVKIALQAIMEPPILFIIWCDVPDDVTVNVELNSNSTDDARRRTTPRGGWRFLVSAPASSPLQV